MTATARATETDQFTTPKAPLHNIGPELSRKVVEIIESDHTGHDPSEFSLTGLPQPLLHAPLARSEVGRLPSPRLRFHLSRGLLVSATFLAASPTVNAYGYYLGTDKLDHFFRQGHEYFELAQAKGVAAAVAHGVKQEHTYFGTLSSGVYSNSDLAANYAGMKFYQNLREVFERTPTGWRLRTGHRPGPYSAALLLQPPRRILNPQPLPLQPRLHPRTSATAASSGQPTTPTASTWSPIRPSFASTWFVENRGHRLPPAEEARSQPSVRSG